MMHMVLTRIKITHFNLNGVEWSFQSFRNGMTTPFLLEWNGVIPFLQEWNEHFIPARME